MKPQTVELKFHIVKSILSKVGFVAKNVIFIPKFSKKTLKRNNFFYEPIEKRKVEFRFGSYLVTTIDYKNPLIKEVQKLRYESFFGKSNETHYDEDKFDKVCDHLIVIDKSKSKNQLVGTYRLLIKPKNISKVDFYSQTEFSIDKLYGDANISLLEAGRSCVLDGYRDGRIIRLLWRALATYIVKNRIDLIFGCASFPSSDYKRFIPQLSYLHNFHAPPRQFNTLPLQHLKADYKIIKKQVLKEEEMFRSLPPLIKAYIRAGAWVGQGAIVDKKFNTTDVLIILKSTKIMKKYSQLAVNQ